MDIPARRSAPYKPGKLWWNRTRSLVRSKLHNFPLLENATVRTWRAARYFFWKAKWTLRPIPGRWRGTYVRHIDVDKTYWLPPGKIVFSSLEEFNLHEFKGHILAGDWDRLEKRFDTLDLYVAIGQVCGQGKEWAETVFYQHALDDLNHDRRLYGLRDESDLHTKCNEIESLYRRIQHDGYRSQKELFLAGEIHDRVLAEEEVAVSVGRFGDLLFSDGAHRLAIAKLLGLPAIPVKIAVRHRGWMALRHELACYGRDDPRTAGARLCQPPTHPDLVDLLAEHKCEVQFALIKENTSLGRGRLLDCGAKLGYFCHRFEEQGLDCYAVEDHPASVYFLKRLARAENRRFKIISDPLLATQEIWHKRFDIVLAFNTFHRYLRTKESFDKFAEFLKNLQVGELYFEPNDRDDPLLRGAYKRFCCDEFVAFLLSTTGLKTATLLGVMNDGKPLVKLS